MTLPAPQWLDTDLYPFDRAVHDVAGHRVHVVDHGTGPTLLLLHGNPTWSFVWRGVITELAPDHRCVAPDLPGFGLSQAPVGFDGRAESIADVLAELAIAMDLRDVVVVVQDWGGPIGLSLAQRMPDRFRGLVIGNTWAWPITGDPHFERFSALLGGRVGAWLIRRLNLVVRGLIPAGHRHRRPTRAEMRHYRHALGTPDRRQASAVLPREIVAAAPFLARVEAGLATLRTLPALLIWADRDIAFRRTELERWQRELPDARTVELPGAGHYLQSDAPQEFAAAVRAFVAQDLGAAVGTAHDEEARA